jgi:hypothetical protein
VIFLRIKFGDELAAQAVLQWRNAERRPAGSFEDDVLLQLNILQTVVFSDHKKHFSG